MARARSFGAPDIFLILLSFVVLFVSVWVWIISSSIPKEIVTFAATFSLIISLVLVISVIILIILRLQERIADLESKVSAPESPSATPAPESIVVVTLNNTERRIINRLAEHGGNLTQEELRRITGLSKSTLSVTLSVLEKKGIISRTLAGRTKMVHLEQDIRR